MGDKIPRKGHSKGVGDWGRGRGPNQGGGAGGGAGGGGWGGGGGGGGGAGRGQGDNRRRTVTHNAYWHFVNMNRGDREWHEASQELSHVWQSLSPEDRKIYTDKARREKEGAKGSTTKYTSTGVSCDVIAKEISAIKNAVERETLDINDSVDQAAETDILKKQFFVMNTNYYCVTKDQMYVTCEVAIAMFCLETGVDLTYHTIVGSVIPLGYASDAMAFSAAIGIPMPPVDGAENDYVKMLSDIKDFLNNCTTENPKNKGSFPPLYVVSEDVKPVNSFLAQLCEAAGEDSSMFKVYLLPKLFHKLRNKVSLEDIEYPLSVASEELSLNTFAYIKELACEFHTDAEEFNNCSLLRVKKLCYMVCDHCANHLGIMLIPGRHIPITINPVGPGSTRLVNNTGRGRFNNPGPSRGNAANDPHDQAAASAAPPNSGTNDFEPVVSKSRRGRGRGNQLLKKD
ncbi:protein maelstrom homolog [Arctopsyche grandis]|uniref:protein maelstrom homolog n=1 Tax=Arctopsyche grandis TaxID=121162 RepID=UPI00406DA1B9